MSESNGPPADAAGPNTPASLPPPTPASPPAAFLPVGVRNWLIAQYLADPNPSRMRLSPGAAPEPTVPVTFTAFAAVLLTAEIDIIPALESWRAAGWVEDGMVELTPSADPTATPGRGITRLNLPLGEHRLIFIRRAVLTAPTAPPPAPGPPAPRPSFLHRTDDQVAELDTAPPIGLDPDLAAAYVAVMIAVRECTRLAAALPALWEDAAEYRLRAAAVHAATEPARAAYNRIDVRLRRAGGPGALYAALNDVLTVRDLAPLDPAARTGGLNGVVSRLFGSLDTLFADVDGRGIIDAIRTQLALVPPAVPAAPPPPPPATSAAVTSVGAGPEDRNAAPPAENPSPVDFFDPMIQSEPPQAEVLAWLTNLSERWQVVDPVTDGDEMALGVLIHAKGIDVRGAPPGPGQARLTVNGVRWHRLLRSAADAIADKVRGAVLTFVWDSYKRYVPPRDRSAPTPPPPGPPAPPPAAAERTEPAPAGPGPSPVAAPPVVPVPAAGPTAGAGKTPPDNPPDGPADGNRVYFGGQVVEVSPRTYAVVACIWGRTSISIDDLKRAANDEVQDGTVHGWVNRANNALAPLPLAWKLETDTVNRVVRKAPR